MIDEEQARAMIKEFNHRLTKDKTRFGVGRKGAKYSAVWAAWEQGSEFYIGANSILGSAKISLHRSGICRFALTERHYGELARQGLEQPSDRAFTKWRRLPTPDVGAAHVLSLIFPTDHLRLDEPITTTKKPVLFLEPPPPRMAVQMVVFYSKQDVKQIEAEFLRVGHPLIYFNLRNGDIVWLVAKKIPFDKTLLPNLETLQLSSGRVLDRAALLKPGQKRENLTLWFWNSPNDGEPFFLWELGGAVMHGPSGSTTGDDVARNMAVVEAAKIPGQE